MGFWIRFQQLAESHIPALQMRKWRYKVISGPAQGHTAINDRYKLGFLEWGRAGAWWLDIWSASLSKPP